MKLHEYRKKHKLTQKQIADMVGVSEQSVRNWESGDKKPTRHFAAIREITGGKVLADSFY